jgi:hypothetical protein
MYMYPPPPPYPYCPECEKRNLREYEKYGFNIVTGAKYWTHIKEIKECCPVKVTVTEAVGNMVTMEINGKKFTKTREEFYKSSWREYDAY